MNIQETSLKRLFVFVAGLVLLASMGYAQVSVSKVEPPNWWAGLPENPMLLLYGSGLSGARVSVAYPGVRVAKVEPGNEGYLFVWLEMSPAVKPGTAKIVVKGSAGTAEVEFPIWKRERSECGKSTAPPSALDDARKGRAPKAQSDCRFAGLTKDDVMYNAMPDRFANGDTANDDPEEAKGYYDRTKARGFHGGDLKGVEDHLSYLNDLGVTALWLTPYWKNANDYHGYGPIDMYAVDPHFGTLDDYKKLAADAHAHGIKMVFDYVVNHTGPDHVWAKKPPLNTWLHGTPEKHPPFDYHFEYLVDPHASPREWKNITEGWFADRLPDLNVDDPHVAKYLLDNAVWWMELGGLDALRLDTFPYSSRKFWSYWHQELFRIYPTTNTVGEVWNFDPTLTSFFEGGVKRWDGVDDGLPTMFDFPLYHTIREVLSADKPASEIPKILRFDSLYQRPDGLVTFLGNHDTKRLISEPGMNVQKVKAAFALQMTMRGIPEIYSGDEIGMTGGDDPDNRHDFPGGWPGDKQNAFEASGRTAEQQEVYAYVKSLLALRKEHSALREGKQWTIGTDANYYAYLRDDGQERVLAIFSKKAGPVEIPLSDTPMASAKTLEPLMGAPEAKIESGVLRVAVADWGVAIYRVR